MNHHPAPDPHKSEECDKALSDANGGGALKAIPVVGDVASVVVDTLGAIQDTKETELLKKFAEDQIATKKDLDDNLSLYNKIQAEIQKHKS